MEERIAGLQMIQAIITRMSNYGFLLKGWGVTLMAALLVLAVDKGGTDYDLFVMFAIFVLWTLDAWFLLAEKRFRLFYDKA